MEFSGFPRIANLDYSPSEAMLSYPDEVDKACFNDDACQTSPNNIMNTFFDPDSIFDQPLAPNQLASTYPIKQEDVFNPTLPPTGISATSSNNNIISNPRPQPQPQLQPQSQPIFNTPPFGHFEQPYPFGFSFDPNSLETTDSAYFSPQTHATSRTPSLCGDASQDLYSPTTVSPHVTKRESHSTPASPSSESTPKRPLRKRGRPRLDTTTSTTSDSPTNTTSTSAPSSAKSHRAARLPHNQVERKYREGLNSELERLRKAVPSLPQSDEGGGMGQPKPSKAMVLSSAIEYIHRIERERDALREENGRLRQRIASGGVVLGDEWMRGGDEGSLDEFLMDP
jgi:hypothetical protein